MIKTNCTISITDSYITKWFLCIPGRRKVEVEGSGGDTLDGIVVVWAKGMFCEPQLHHQL